MESITLEGKSGLGKNRVRELGSSWRVLRVEQKVHFSTRPGPWLSVEPVGREDAARFRRWVHETDDANFVVSLAGPSD